MAEEIRRARLALYARPVQMSGDTKKPLLLEEEEGDGYDDYRPVRAGEDDEDDISPDESVSPAAPPPPVAPKGSTRNLGKTGFIYDSAVLEMMYVILDKLLGKEKRDTAFTVYGYCKEAAVVEHLPKHLSHRSKDHVFLIPLLKAVHFTLLVIQNQHALFWNPYGKNPSTQIKTLLRQSVGITHTVIKDRLQFDGEHCGAWVCYFVKWLSRQPP